MPSLGDTPTRPSRPGRTTDPSQPPLVLRSALVGRDTQLAVLRDVVARAIDFQAPQLVTVVGNRGTGKTRLVAELCAGLTAPVRVFQGRARAGEKQSALASLLNDRFGIAVTPGAPSPIDPAKLVAAEVGKIVGGGDATEVLHFLGGYLGLDFPSSPFLKLLTEDALHKDVLARTVLRRLIELDAGTGPLVLVLDDLQWADDDTLATLSELARGLTGSPVVIIAAARPEMLVRCPSWGQGAVDHERLDLRNLEGDDAEVMFANLLARCGRVPDELISAVPELTGGNPAFIEQLVKLYLRHGAIDTSGTLWRLDVDAALAIELPIGIEEAIEARIATLEQDERELLEKASVFGNVFWLSAVVALARLELSPRRPADALELEWGDGEGVRRRVSDLVHSLAERDYLLVLDPADSTVAGDVEIVFKHNLEREVVVKSIDAGRLARYHLAAAQWLEARLTDKSEEQLEFLTGLYERGGDLVKAARCYLLGADRARARWANEEARSMYERGLSLLGENDTPARMDALHNLGDVLDLSGETELAMARFDEMLDLAWLYDNQRKAGAAHSRIARVLRRQGQYDPAMNHLRRANELFTAAQDDRGIASTLDDIGRVHWLRGAYGQALDFHRQALTLRKQLGDRRSIALSVANIGRVHFDSGSFKPAIAQFREALDLRRDINDLSGVVQSLCDLAQVYGADGNHGLALELLADAHRIANEIGDKQSQAEVLSRAGEHKTSVGRAAEAVADLGKARELARVVGDRLALAEINRRAAEAALACGDLAGAERDAKQALSLGEGLGARVQIGAAHRVMAAIAEARGDGAAADAEYRRSIDILSTMRNEIELARAFRAFADFRAARGEATEAGKLRERADEVFGRLRAAAQTE
ncbi:MAG TPA: tetratricopeptide repeat protein [Kofleriaceae bacterium]|nr:tetratricopeptide repeat protein [Kofleriaceae bacterium]